MAYSADDVVAFVHIVELGSFRGAARRLGRSPATVSKRVAALEAELGTELLRRTTRSVTLTDPGRMLYDEVRQVPRLLDEGSRRILQLAEEPAGDLRVVVPSYFASADLWSRVIPMFSERHPAVRLDVRITSDPVDELKGDYDLLVAGKLPNQAFPDLPLKGRRLLELPATLVGAPSYLEAHAPVLHPGDLQKLNCVSYPRRDWLFNDPEGGHLVVDVTGSLTTNSNELLRDAIVRGVGVTYSFPFVFHDDIAAGRVVSLLQDYAAHVEVYLFYPPTRWVPAATRAFIDALLEPLDEPRAPDSAGTARSTWLPR